MYRLYGAGFCIFAMVPGIACIFDEIAGFIARQETPRNIEPSPFLIIGQHSWTHLIETFDIPKMSVRIDCSAPKLPGCTTLIFSSKVLSLSVILNALFLPLLNSAAHFFHCAIRKKLLLKDAHEVFTNFLGSHSFLTKVLGNSSDLKFIHIANVLHLPLLKVIYTSKQAWPHAFYTSNVLQLDQMTKSLNSMNLTEAYRSRTF